MNFMELAKVRYSCRKFSDKPVEDDKINYILNAGMLSPTAVNFQPQKIYVLKSKEALEKVSECTKYSFNAPLNFLICYDTNVSWKRGYDGKDFGNTDASIVAAHMMLAATELGLGTTWVGSFDPCKAREMYNLADNIVPALFLPTGYPTQNAHPSHHHDNRKDLSEIAVFI